MKTFAAAILAASVNAGCTHYKTPLCVDHFSWLYLSVGGYQNCMISLGCISYIDSAELAADEEYRSSKMLNLLSEDDSLMNMATDCPDGNLATHNFCHEFAWETHYYDRKTACPSYIKCMEEDGCTAWAC